MERMIEKSGVSFHPPSAGVCSNILAVATTTYEPTASDSSIWPTVRQTLERFLTDAQASDASLPVTSENLHDVRSVARLLELGRHLAGAAQWARQKRPHTDATTTAQLAEYHHMLAQLLLAMGQLQIQLKQRREHLRSERGHFQVVQAWAQRSRMSL